MLKNYFNDFNKKSAGKGAAAKTGSKKTSGKSTGVLDVKSFIEKLDLIIPAHLKISPLKPIDSKGFSPDGADYIIYKEYCRDIDKLLSGYIPFELIHGAFFLVPELKKNAVADVLNRVATVKKINSFSEEESTFLIPSFIISSESKDYSLLDIKNDVINYYISKGVESEAEFEIMMVYNQGIIIKDWHSGKRSFVGLKTGEDTLMWFFILITEYLSIEREDEFDIRKYVRSDKVYDEF